MKSRKKGSYGYDWFRNHPKTDESFDKRKIRSVILLFPSLGFLRFEKKQGRGVDIGSKFFIRKLSTRAVLLIPVV